MELQVNPVVKQTRHSDRISIAVPVEVFGTEITGQDFCETTRTHMVSRHGAAIVLKRPMAPLQEVTIRNLSNGKEAAAEVVGPMGGRTEGSVYGIILLDHQLNLWNTNFPESTVLGVHLECNACSQREMVYLDTIESEVFEANQKLTRLCDRCTEPTVWHPVAHNFAEDQNARIAKPKPLSSEPESEASGSRDDRKHTRVRMAIAACLLHPGFGTEEVVTVEDISRGGLSFRTANNYHLGSVIEVAAPYMAQAANVFVRARVVSVENRSDSQPRLYAVAYLKKQA